jgi:molybdopterin converting factor subunit 1
MQRTAMLIKVLYFGRLKEVSGSSEESVELLDGARIEDLFSQCALSRPELRKFRPSLVAARNREFAAWNTPLHAGDEIGFLPPVSGG